MTETAGEHCSTELVRGLVRELGLVPCQPRPWRHSLAEADPAAGAIPDLVARDFTATARRDRRHDAASSVVFCEPCTDLRPGGEPQLGQNVFEVRLGGALADDQGFRDFSVGQPLCGEHGDLMFTWGEQRRGICLRWCRRL